MREIKSKVSRELERFRLFFNDWLAIKSVYVYCKVIYVIEF